MSNRTPPLILKFSDWPDHDVKLWATMFASGGLFDEGGQFAVWSDGTRKLHMQNYGSWLSFIRCHYPELMAHYATDRIAKETVSFFIEEGKQRLKLRSLSNQIFSLAIVAKGFSPNKDWEWLFNAAYTIYSQSDAYQLKPPLPISATDIFKWSLMRLKLTSTHPSMHPIRRAVAFRQALIVGLLIARPVRLRAFVGMTVNSDLELFDSGITLRFQATDMKDKKARRFPCPEELVPHIHEYHDIHRPLLLNANSSDHLWISERGDPLSRDSFTSGLAKLTKRAFGITLRPHAFCHIAATSIAASDPEHVDIIRDVLGHATLRMAERHYDRATAVGASHKLQDALRAVRSKEAKKPNRRRNFKENKDW